ncbi:MAG: hypothetical protein RBR35_15585 [Salinivirgaceae bacterium]|nr:hypothetical protein [Salinivirgaceae bacterium]
MKNMTKTMILMTILFLFAGCSDPLTEKTISVSDVSITGDGNKYVKVVDGSYVLRPVDDVIVMAIKFELIEKFNKKGDYEFGNISLLPLDIHGTAIPNIGSVLSPATSSDYDKLKSLLNENVGKQVVVNFEWSYFSKTKIQKRIMAETTSFEITRADISKENSESTTETDETVETTEVVKTSESKKTTENWDEVLEEYESLINKYIKLMKKIESGDVNAMTEFSEVLENATSLAEKLQHGQEEMTASQASKFIALYTKLANAAAGM